MMTSEQKLVGKLKRYTNFIFRASSHISCYTAYEIHASTVVEGQPTDFHSISGSGVSGARLAEFLATGAFGVPRVVDLPGLPGRQRLTDGARVLPFWRVSVHVDSARF